MKSLGLILSNAIKEGKWLYITYNNKNEQITSFWCCIFDIIIEKKALIVHMYNKFKGDEILEKKLIYVDSIKSAKVIEGTNYHVPDTLIKKIENNLNKLDWLKYDTFNNNILQYLKECYRNDNDPYQKEYELIEGIDYRELKEKKKYKLNNVQFGKIIDNIYKTELNENNRYNYQQLSINILSISVEKKLYVVAHKTVLLDLYEKSLILCDQFIINKFFLIEGKRYSLSQYLDIDPDLFVKNFPNKYQEYKELLHDNLQKNEILDDLPFLMIIERNLYLNIEETYQAIEEAKEKRTLGIPIKAFFGNITTKSLRDKEVPIFFINKNFNIDQLRVVYNALKNPLTYVQGPPGTGKTSTIINIALSAFINGKSVLFVSNNNKPVDDIYSRIQFYHKKKLVPFPILRLGKKEENLQALTKIKQLYKDSKAENIRPKQLDIIKTMSVNNFMELNELLKRYERRLKISENIDILTNLLKITKGIVIKTIIGKELQTYQEEYDKIGFISDEDVTKFTFIAENDHAFTQYLYYKSFQYLKELSKPKYKDLLEIINLPDNTLEEQNNKNNLFIKYLADNEKMSLFIRIFPFIATTNLSSNRLGKPTKYFDICVMDEAGQCNISTSLIPMVRCKNLVLVGDQNQLQPVVVLEESLNEKLMDKYKINKVYDYRNNSILKLMLAKDKVSPFILLRYHYRCGKKIIQFSNSRYYDNKLKLDNVLDGNQLELVSVRSDTLQEQRNASYQEAIAIVDIIKKNKYIDVGIITPFRNQAELIRKVLTKENINGIDVGTIHTFQGDEKKVIILSTAITQATSDNTYNWVKNNKEMINVAVTRAKEKLIMVSDYEKIKNKSSSNDDDLYSLAQYIKTKGDYKVAPSKTTEMLGLKMYDTQKEADFFKTIFHFTSVVSNIEVKTKVKISSVFTDLNIKDKEYYFKGEFDFVLYDKKSKLPLLVIELDGIEHINNRKTILNDRRKEKICMDNNIKIIRIPNNYVKRYEYVKELLIKCIG